MVPAGVSPLTGTLHILQKFAGSDAPRECGSRRLPLSICVHGLVRIDFKGTLLTFMGLFGFDQSNYLGQFGIEGPRFKTPIIVLAEGNEHMRPSERVSEQRLGSNSLLKTQIGKLGRQRPTDNFALGGPVCIVQLRLQVS